jgi:hypothetical protein
MCSWLAPIPRVNRSPNASVSVRQPACIVTAERAYIDAIPVATPMRLVPANNNAHDANGSRPTASGTQMQP